MVRLGKSLWIPSTAEDFPSARPVPRRTGHHEGRADRPGGRRRRRRYVVTSRLGNILYEKTKKDIVSELWCPVLYNEYVVGYIHVWNTGGPPGAHLAGHLSSSSSSSRRSSATPW